MVNFADNDIAVLHMYSGAFLIGRVFREGGTPRLRKARQINFQPNGPGQVSISFIPIGIPIFDETDAETMDFPPTDQILIAKKADPNMTAAYTKMTSGIHLAGVSAGFKLPQG